MRLLGLAVDVGRGGGGGGYLLLSALLPCIHNKDLNFKLDL